MGDKNDDNMASGAGYPPDTRRTAPDTRRTAPDSESTYRVPLPHRKHASHPITPNIQGAEPEQTPAKRQGPTDSPCAGRYVGDLPVRRRSGTPPEYITNIRLDEWEGKQRIREPRQNSRLVKYTKDDR